MLTFVQYICPQSAYRPRPPRLLTNESLWLVDMSGRNISQWTLMTHAELHNRRYGGWQLAEHNAAASTINASRSAYGWRRLVDSVTRLARMTLVEFNGTLLADTNVTAADWMQQLDRTNNVRVWYDNKGWAAMSAFTNAYYNVLYRSANRTGSLQLINWPMRNTAEERKASTEQVDTMLAVVTVILLILAFGIIPASFVLFLIDERANHSKHLQFVSGLSPLLYWIANLLWDLVSFYVVADQKVIAAGQLLPTNRACDDRVLHIQLAGIHPRRVRTVHRLAAVVPIRVRCSLIAA